MDILETQLKTLNTKLQSLLKRHQLLLKENDVLKKEVEALRIENNEEKKSAQTLQQQVDILRMNNGLMNDDEKRILEKKIDGYLNDIEKCITLLNE